MTQHGRLQRILILVLVIGAAPDAVTARLQAPSAPSASRKLVIVDRTGRQTMAGSVPANTWGPRVSRDGRWLALTLTGDTRSGDMLYVAPLMNPAAMRPLGPGRNPHWSHDGTRLFFSGANTETLLWRRVDTDDAGEALLTPVRAPESLSADGRTLSYVQALDDRFTGWTLDLATRTHTLIPDSGPESLGTNISPDGRWIAYQSTRSGRYEVWVQPLARPGTAVQVTQQGGYRPLWAADMREMYFDDGNRRLFAVPVRTGAEFVVAGPAVALPIEGFVQTGIGRRMYDLLPDGRFLMIFP